MHGTHSRKTLINGGTYTLYALLGDIVVVVFSIWVFIVTKPIFFRVAKRELKSLYDQARKISIEDIPIEKEGIKIIDSMDWEILNVVRTKGGSLLTIEEEALKWTTWGELRRRIQKLLALGYLEVGEYEVLLTPEGMDILNLPPILLARRIDDPDILRKMARIRVYLRKGEAHSVIVESSKLLEDILRRRIKDEGLADEFRRRHPKGLEKATLGELIAGCSPNELNLIDKFETRVAYAFNEIRTASVHPSKGVKKEAGIDEAYMAYTLLEVFVNHYFSRKQRG